MLKQETCNEKLPSFNPWAYESFTQSTSSAFLVKRDNSYWINKSERHFLLSYMILNVGFYSKIIITNHEGLMNLTMKLLLFFFFTRNEKLIASGRFGGGGGGGCIPHRSL